jgi:hypothetical protein
MVRCTHYVQDMYKKPYTFQWTSLRNLSSTIRSGEKSCIDEKDTLTICPFLNLAYANQNNSVLLTKKHTLFCKYFTQNLAFTKYTTG